MIFSTLRLWKRACNLGQDMARIRREDLPDTPKPVGLLSVLPEAWNVSGFCTITLGADSGSPRVARVLPAAGRESICG